MGMSHLIGAEEKSRSPMTRTEMNTLVSVFSIMLTLRGLGVIFSRIGPSGLSFHSVDPSGLN